MESLLNANCEDLMSSIRAVQAHIDSAIVVGHEEDAKVTSSVTSEFNGMEGITVEGEKQQQEEVKHILPQTVQKFHNLLKRKPEFKDSVKVWSDNDTKHCKTCDIPLTSIQVAKQHYIGRKHLKMVATMGKPSLVQKASKVENDGRFGIGDAFKLPRAYLLPSPPAANFYVDTKPEPKKPEVGKTLKETCNPVHCKVCDIYVSSYDLLRDHEGGSKHLRKVHLLGKGVTVGKVTDVPAHATNVSQSLKKLKGGNPDEDWSMYRTPSGAFYCSSCNINLTHVDNLKAHLMGKKHIKKLASIQ